MLLGVDIGTTNLKILAIDANSLQLVAHTARPVATLSPKPDYAEQDPEVIWRLFLDAMQEMLAVNDVATGSIDGLCFSTAMHSLLAVDDAGKPLTNALIWSDNRVSAEAGLLKKDHADLYKIIGVPIHPMLPLCKLMWFNRTNPRLLKRAARWLSIKEYIWWKLTGRYEIDYATAAATGLFDAKKNAWYVPALTLAGVRVDQLSTPVNTIHRADYEGLKVIINGLAIYTPLIIGASDGCLANLGAGAIEAGITTITIGTSGAVRRSSPRPIRDGQGRLFSYPLYRNEAPSHQTYPVRQGDCYAVGGPTNNGANVLEWVAQKFANIPIPDVLMQVANVPAGADGLLFRPYLHGERAPLWDATVRGSFHHVDWQHTQAHFMRAALEGVLFNLREIDLLLSRHTGPTRVIHANGGFAQSAVWVQMMADVFGVPVRLNASNESSAIGAVLLARFALAAGSPEPVSLGEMANQITFGNTYLPDPDRHKTYLNAFKMFASL